MCVYVCPCKACCSPIDVAFVLDSSSNSQGSGGWTQLLSFVNTVIDRFTVSQTAIRVAVVLYGDNAQVSIRLGQYNDANSLKSAVSRLGYLNSRGNNLADAFDALRTQVFTTNVARSGEPWVAFVVAGQNPTVRTQDTVTAASQARAAGIQIIPIGLVATSSIISQIAYASFQQRTVNSYGELAGLSATAADWICNSHLSEW